MNKKSASISFVLATVLLDAIGIGIIIPIMPDVIRRFSSDAEFINNYYGYFVSAYSLMQLIASPILGALSDRFGRRPILLCSLLGAGADYLLMAFAPNLSILFLGRIIAGLTGASMTVASSYIADISSEKDRTGYFGMMGAGFGIGFILGPVLGGFFGSFGSQYSFMVAAGLNLLNFIFALFILPESLPPSQRRQVEVSRLNPFRSVIQVFIHSPVIPLIWVYLLLNLAGQSYPSVWTLYTQYLFSWSSWDVGVSLTAVGVMMAIAQGGMVRWITPRFGERKTLYIGVTFALIGYFLFSVVTQGWMIYATILTFLVSGTGMPALQTMISKSTPSREQGELQGSLVSIMSLTAVAGPVLYTHLFSWFTFPGHRFHFPGVVFFLAAMICVLNLIILASYREKRD